MSTTAERMATQIPRGMRTLQRDGRGYPIPFITMRDRVGVPHFTVNDQDKVAECVSNKLCGICGRRFTDGMWFVGGPKCFVHQQGAFLDPPLHGECAEYALRVCPYLAVPSYGRRLDDRKLSPAAVPDKMSIVKHAEMADDRPDLFGFGLADEVVVMRQPEGYFLYAVPRWRHVEFWRFGSPLDHAPDADFIRKSQA